MRPARRPLAGPTPPRKAAARKPTPAPGSETEAPPARDAADGPRDPGQPSTPGHDPAGAPRAASVTEREPADGIPVGDWLAAFSSAALEVFGERGEARLAERADAAWEQELVCRLGLDHLLARYPEQLSGGQQQRVAIGRTLAARPSLVLADEPTGNLDEATGEGVLDLMLSLCKGVGSALLLVTHSTRLAARLDRKVGLRGGKIIA